MTFGRDTSYIGVMIDDLTTRGVTEPYRMFTSRAEFRLSLRADNADQRLTPLGRDVGLVGDRRWEVFSEKRDQLTNATEFLSSKMLSARAIAATGVNLVESGPSKSAYDALALADFTADHLVEAVPEALQFAPSIREQIKRDALYATYIKRQEREVEALAREEQLRLPSQLNYDAIEGLSYELKLKLKRSQPETIAQASRIDGMTPAALIILTAVIKRADQKKAAV